eukprot:CAMPEP_0183335014 /NCGR_PEP_ID=MMETSP0164_2-20130417/3435_1 /TAXON_ID=221442 /ORGANISM="Coccolithus pelagicus ssp braarudi, Strain PLY182g" /LENGTH=142 /DNA_ID=CAMNT_0025504269 /DNA_START=225 /DNA_END=653 /DNA_ORIENTATION=+
MSNDKIFLESGQSHFMTNKNDHHHGQHFSQSSRRAEVLHHGPDGGEQVGCGHGTLVLREGGCAEAACKQAACIGSVQRQWRHRTRASLWSQLGPAQQRRDAARKDVTLPSASLRRARLAILEDKLTVAQQIDLPLAYQRGAA